MANVSRYCKAYLLKQLRQFEDWSENLEESNNEEPKSLTDEDILYLHENYVVTTGVYLDKNIIFAKITSEWKQYCNEVLEFEIPAYLSVS